MTRSTHFLLRLSVLTGYGLLAGSLAYAAPLSIDQLMSGLARQPQGAATFTETKSIAMLEQPIESSGELLFVPPARLEKRTLKPRPESMVLDGETLTLTRGRRTHVLRLQDYPQVAGMIESIRATLAGDRKALEKVYRLALNGESERWTLTLTPLDPKVGKLISRIRMEGARSQVRSVEILQADGDSSVMTIDTPPAP
ncbi:MAG: outer membrane lipoprotein carrier protein LolA [Thiobacillus sp.]|nr:outer membrane lipoprotein carrier protein LolA [Thiobacillus sp.]